MSATAVQSRSQVLAELPTIKKRDMKRNACPECHKGIRKRQIFVWIDGERVHELCAGFAHKLPTCTRCFMTKCDCED